MVEAAGAGAGGAGEAAGAAGAAGAADGEIDADAWRAEWRALSQSMVFDQVWGRGRLSARERRLLAIALTISSQSQGAVKHHLRAALDEGVEPQDLFETILHTAMYAGWPKGGFAIQACAEVAAERRGTSTREG